MPLGGSHGRRKCEIAEHHAPHLAGNASELTIRSHERRAGKVARAHRSQEALRNFQGPDRKAEPLKVNSRNWATSAASCENYTTDLGENHSTSLLRRVLGDFPLSFILT